MTYPFFLLITSLAGIIAALILPGWSDLLLLAVPSALAALILLLRQRAAKPNSPPKPKPKYVVVDGSNVLYWKDGTPQIDTVQQVVRKLTALGYTPSVVFDANAGYLIAGKYHHHHAMEQALGLPANRVIVVDKGEPADPVILAQAQKLDALIITNDRYRDWAELYPKVLSKGHLIRGGYRSGKMWLNLKPLPE